MRYVINEHWPYYAYQTMGRSDSREKRKLGRLYFRIANHLQPGTVIDLCSSAEYLRTACPKAEILGREATLAHETRIELAIVPIQTEYNLLLSLCDEQSVVVFESIYMQPELWHCIEHDPRTTVTFDLHYCGIVFFDQRRSPNNYIINF